MIYVDFDGVIMDTYLPIFADYLKRKDNGEVVDDILYVINKDWNNILSESLEINNSLSYLKLMRNVTILTKIHSMENEGNAKINFLRKNGIKNDIILVPYMFKKTDIVSAKGNTLIDDAIFNLDDFSKDGGTSIFFNKDGLDTDGYGVTNTKYVKTRSLDILRRL